MMAVNPNNRAPGTSPPPHPDFGDPFKVEPGQARLLPPGQAIRDGVHIKHTKRAGKPWISMRPVPV